MLQIKDPECEKLLDGLSKEEQEKASDNLDKGAQKEAATI